jgi:N-acetylmuramoyl-L-alanine amidase
LYNELIMGRIFFMLCFFGIVAPVLLHGQDSLIQAVASPGEGVYSLLRKHGADPAEVMDDFIALNQPRLSEEVGLYAGTTYLIPSEKASSSDTRYEIFGPDHAEVELKSDRLQGAVFYLVSGHGGPDPGAMTSYKGTSISEDEYAYDVTLRLGKNLLSHGALVYIIIRDPDDGIRDERLLEMDTDEVAYPQEDIPLGQPARLKQRVKTVNRLYASHKGKHQRLIVTHVDSRSKGQNIDVFFYHHHKSKNGKKLAEHIHSTFKKKYARYQPGRTYTGTFEDRSTLYLVKNTHPATAFIEIGNIRNSRDQRRILEPDNRQALANWICLGVLSDYESN